VKERPRAATPGPENWGTRGGKKKGTRPPEKKSTSYGPGHQGILRKEKKKGKAHKPSPTGKEVPGPPALQPKKERGTKKKRGTSPPPTKIREVRPQPKGRQRKGHSPFTSPKKNGAAPHPASRKGGGEDPWAAKKKEKRVPGPRGAPRGERVVAEEKRSEILPKKYQPRGKKSGGQVVPQRGGGSRGSGGSRRKVFARKKLCPSVLEEIKGGPPGRRERKRGTAPLLSLKGKVAPLPSPPRGRQPRKKEKRKWFSTGRRKPVGFCRDKER